MVIQHKSIFVCLHELFVYLRSRMTTEFLNFKKVIDTRPVLSKNKKQVKNHWNALIKNKLGENWETLHPKKVLDWFFSLWTLFLSIQPWWLSSLMRQYHSVYWHFPCERWIESHQVWCINRSRGGGNPLLQFSMQNAGPSGLWYMPWC